MMREAEKLLSVLPVLDHHYRQSLLQFSSVTSSSTSPQMLTEETIRATSTARQHRRAQLAMHVC